MEDDTKANSMMNHNMLTKREYAAIEIMKSIIVPHCDANPEHAATAAKVALQFADALFDALARKAGE